MKTNKCYYEISKKYLEKIIDPYYAKDKLIIPNSKNESNELTQNNDKLIDLITTYSCLYTKIDLHSQKVVEDIINEIINILDNTENINYSALTQFFMVYNTNYTLYKNLSKNDKKVFLYDILKLYCKERHNIYKSHGYSNISLQVMCDNYSHKRNSKSGIDKVLDILENCKLIRLSDKNDITKNINYYLLPDKGDKVLFEEFIKILKINMESRKNDQNKLPDIVFKYNSHYYICELKNMKEGGGGQYKQIAEIYNFIKYSETKDIHYVAFLDGIYFNKLFSDDSQKIETQRNDIEKALNDNPNNYFLNTVGLEKFVEDLVSK